MSFEWNQIPLFFSQDTRTLFTTTTPLGQLRIDDPIQTGAQSNPQTLRAAAGLAQPFDLRLKRSIADVRALYSVNENLDLNLFFRSTAKTGSSRGPARSASATRSSWRSPCRRTRTSSASAASGRTGAGSVRVGYDGSFFRNDTERSSGTTRCASPIRRRPVRCRAACRSGPTAT